ncbi:UvrB/UvrC motif-containing protein [bacterium]|nr:UvrB/UvrC motif-containing protein [bacterium]
MTTCDKCEKPAIYHDVRIVNGIHNTTHLCADHAIEKGINLGPIDLSIVLQETGTVLSNDNMKCCEDCGMTIAQYKENSLLGCPTCYETFKEELEHIISKVQDNHTQHVGRAPSQTTFEQNRHLQIRRLLKKLETAVHKEEYEEAAVLRDQLRDLHDASDHHEN